MKNRDMTQFKSISNKMDGILKALICRSVTKEGFYKQSHEKS